MKGGGSGWTDTSRPTGGGYSACAAALCPNFLGLIAYLLVRGNYTNWKCPRCGGPVRESYTACPQCGAKLKASCHNCGVAIQETSTPMELNALMIWEEPEFQFEVEASEEVYEEHHAQEQFLTY